jgi:phosphoribosyl 1,2-cyclic phosphodiesterase
MNITFWGVRGSIPCPGPRTVKYGGNTTCLELRFEHCDRLIIIDAGTGIRLLGNELLRRELARGVRELDIYLTHTHWDHILGFPFFAPMYVPNMIIRIHGPATCEQDALEKVLRGQFEYRYFPVRMEELAADIRFVELRAGVYDLGDGIRLRTKYLNHPVSCLGYRFEHGGKALVTAFDTEPYRNLFVTDPASPERDSALVREGEADATEQNRLAAEFIAGADLVVHDAQYTRREYLDGRIGWGHSAMEDVVDSCARGRVGCLALTHHDPDRTDDQLDALSAWVSSQGEGMEVFFAREGMIVEV